MDLTIPIVGILTYLGYTLSDVPGVETEDSRKKRKKISANDNPSGKNVYHSNFSKEIDIRERQIADSIFKKSKLPSKTGIIPPLYNTECTWACDKKLSEYVVFPEETKIIQDHLVDIRRKKKDKSVIIDGPMFTRSMAGISIAVEDSPSKNYSMRGQSTSKENFDPGVSELSGLPVDMSHSNMVPFFGSNIKQNTDFGRNSSILDNYTGSGNDKIVKDSVVQLFKPEVQEIHGTKTFGDTIGVDRFVPSRFKQGEKLIQEIRVQPIPEAALRSTYKNVDEMRVSGKEKIEFLKPLTSGKRFITDRGVSGIFAKNKPDTYYENNKLFTGAAEKTAPMSRSDYSETKFGKKGIVSGAVISTVRGKNIGFTAQTQRISRLGDKIDGHDGDEAVMTSVRRSELEQDWVRNVDGSGKYDALDDFIHRDSYNPNTQERESIPSFNVGPVKSRIPETYPVLLDKPRTTNKELNLFTYSGPGGRSTEGNESRQQYENMEIYTHRESVVDTKGYVAGKNNKNSVVLSGIGSHEFREDTQRELLFNFHDSNKSSASPYGVSEKLFGNNTNITSKEDLEVDFTERLVDKRLVEVLKNNPIATEFSRK